MGKHLNVWRYFMYLSHPGPEQAVCRRVPDGSSSIPRSKESLRRQEWEPQRRWPRGNASETWLPSPTPPLPLTGFSLNFLSDYTLLREAPGEAGGTGRDVWRPGLLIIQNAFTLCYSSYLLDISLEARQP